MKAKQKTQEYDGAIKKAVWDVLHEAGLLRTHPDDDDSRWVDVAWCERRVALTRWTIWKLEQKDPPGFPVSIPLGGTDGKPGKRVYLKSEVENWMKKKIAER